MALVLALLMWLTPAVAGLVQISDPARVLSAVVLVCVGQGIAGVIASRRAKTTINPVQARLASSLVTDGVYCHTRNPMYVGFCRPCWRGPISQGLKRKKGLHAEAGALVEESVTFSGL